MSQKERHSYYLDLTSRYLSGNASDQEVRELEEWVLADPDNKQTFMAFKKAWILTGVDQAAAIPHTDQVWKETAAQLFEPAKEVKLQARVSRRRWMGIAAAVAVMALVVTVIFLRPWESPSLMASATENTSELLELSDGSEVVLNRSSSLSYQLDRKASQRRVELTGDAFFDVKHDEQRAFIIATQELEIEVLGTSFYVDAREGQPQVQVMVESGRVAVRTSDQEQILEAKQTAVFTRATRQLEKITTRDENFLALKTKTLIFEETPLPEVIFALNRYYHTAIQLGSEELTDCNLNSTFTDKSLETVLKVLETSFDIEVEQQGNAIMLTGNCLENE
jgi:transmembrane sensor